MSALLEAIGLGAKAAASGMPPGETDILEKLEKVAADRTMSRAAASDLFLAEGRDRWPDEPSHVRTEKLLRTEVGRKLAQIASNGPIAVVRPSKKARDAAREAGQAEFDRLVDAHVMKHKCARPTATAAVAGTPEGRAAYHASRGA